MNLLLFGSLARADAVAAHSNSKQHFKAVRLEILLQIIHVHVQGAVRLSCTYAVACRMSKKDVCRILD